MKTRIVKITEDGWIPQYIPQYRFMFIWFSFKKELYGNKVTVKFNSMNEAISFINSREDKLPKDGKKTYYYKDVLGNYKRRGEPVNHSTPPEHF